MNICQAASSIISAISLRGHISLSEVKQINIIERFSVTPYAAHGRPNLERTHRCVKFSSC